MRTVLSVASVALLLLSLVVLVPQNALAGGGGGGGGGGGSKGGSSGIHLNFGGYGGHSGWGYGSYPYHTYRYPYYGYSYPLAVPNAEPVAVPSALARIVNPATNGASLTFLVNNQRFVLPAGMQQDVSFVPGQTIQFDRGPGRGMAVYSLESATFTFSPTPVGWELYRTVTGASAANIAADNTPATGNPPVPSTTPQGMQPTLPTANAPVPITR